MELVTNYVMYIATWSWDCGGIHNGHFEFVFKFEVVTGRKEICGIGAEHKEEDDDGCGVG
jgi:hypothetical protein